MEKKTAIITGGNRGIGFNITESFIQAGYTVIVGARNENGIEKKLPSKPTFMRTDVRNESDMFALVQKAIDLTGRLDVFVNNAGFSKWLPIDKIDNEFLNDILATNLKSVFWGCKAAVSVMKRGGSIINISSIAGKRGSLNNSAYVATKFAMNGLTQSLAKELGPREIRVNGVCPVLVATEGLFDALKSPHAPANGKPEEFIKKFATENSALKRLPTAKEVAAMCVFLASDSASAITGQNINVDCGVYPQ
jgi:NAD(P)-dependent dehydrogenase (short-subunit alcohol dehydrogenase family)